MRGERFGKQLLKIFVAAILLCLSSPFVQAQKGRRAAASSPPPPESETAAEVRVLSSMIHDLQAQVQSLNSQLGDLRAEQQQTSEEARALRHELDLAKTQMIPSLVESAGQYSTPGSVPINAPPGAASTLAAPQGATEAERISKLEENQDVIDAKVNDQYQTKVESGSKYRLRLSGIVLLNLYDNRGFVDNQDFPEVAQPPGGQPIVRFSEFIRGNAPPIPNQASGLRSGPGWCANQR
jgi:outer membrane murein-binding lipoprotein Lpp